MDALHGCAVYHLCCADLYDEEAALILAIEVEGLFKRYKEKIAVRGATFAVEQGEIFGIVGPNGAGKTTTLEIMEGLRKRDSGRIAILGLDPARQPYELRQRIGVQFQTTAIQERLRVGEALRLFAGFYEKRGHVDQIVKSLGLEGCMRTSFKDLSGGWRQRVSLALATLHDPEVVFLDEPSTGLDPQARRELWGLILGLKEQGKTVVVTTHYMEEAERLCDRVAMFKDGQVAMLDTPKRLVADMAAAHFLAADIAGPDESALVSLPGVDRVEAVGPGSWRIYGADRQKLSLALFQEADRANWTINHFEYGAGTLEDLFVVLAREGEET